MSRKSKFSLAKKVSVVGIPLILIQLGYILFFNRGETVPVREAIDRAVEKVGGIDDRRRSLLRVQLAVQDYMTKHEGKAPDSLDLLRPDYFDSIPVDPATHEQFLYKLSNNRPIIGANPVVQASETATTQTGGQGDGDKVAFVYDPTGKRDPFRPFDFGPRPQEDTTRSPLERYEISQLKLTAVLLDASLEPSAIVENNVGKGFTVKKGMKIGVNSGEVVDILPDRVVILETQVDFTGEKKTRTVEMKLRTRDQEQPR